MEIWQQRRLDEDKQRRFDQRSPYQRDRARILHSAAFRRLQAKTQVLGVGMNDFYRTRLTHSLEVSQIGTGIAALLRTKRPELNHLLGDDALIDALCLAHDIGHPPFGHGGEIALNFMMRDFGGFEGNGQTLRILTKLEPYTLDDGMNLCRRTLLGVLKYPVLNSAIPSLSQPSAIKPFAQVKASDWLPNKALYDDDADILEWILSPLASKDIELLQTLRPKANGQLRSVHKSLDCSIMELADDIAYAVHDLEDAIVMGIVNQAQWQEQVQPVIASSLDEYIREHLSGVTQALFSNTHHLRKNAIGILINALVTAIDINDNPEFSCELLRYNACLSAPFELLLNCLKTFVSVNVVHKPEVQMLEYKGQQMIMKLFEAFQSDPMRLLPTNTRARYQQMDANHGNSTRVIADYIGGMTDDFATRLYQQLFSPYAGNILDFGPE
ncbi:deoxyguanosinetriphosphate triphosphohydrolase family protein [Shewanella sp. SNU WT4]|uniref:anti-phage deoxyguanosine triphosphatase n=1 Tax=Shewanella sp. SNU WT4 TaxID=2590015 RepID=UPI00112B55C4|nr:anti-phage deoxyguanosine triphosphatase [Shewanella sp. SNU WT4]QDF67182.1 deoxyguanosinetriphosphate triphosphohydrolase family protein [Shewanella sp. SNU WT4]